MSRLKSSAPADWISGSGLTLGAEAIAVTAGVGATVTGAVLNKICENDPAVGPTKAWIVVFCLEKQSGQAPEQNRNSRRSENL